jgi:hypothetical protein
MSISPSTLTLCWCSMDREAAMAENSFMASYLPLLHECLPEVAADVEAQIASSLDSLHTKGASCNLSCISCSGHRIICN